MPRMGEEGAIMNQCPKCGHGVFNGPTYRPFTIYQTLKISKECLVYACAQCGYQKTQPTLDSIRKEQTLNENLIQ